MRNKSAPHTQMKICETRKALRLDIFASILNRRCVARLYLSFAVKVDFDVRRREMFALRDKTRLKAENAAVYPAAAGSLSRLCYHEILIRSLVSSHFGFRARRANVQWSAQEQRNRIDERIVFSFAVFARRSPFACLLKCIASPSFALKCN